MTRHISSGFLSSSDFNSVRSFVIVDRPRFFPRAFSVDPPPPPPPLSDMESAVGGALLFGRKDRLHLLVPSDVKPLTVFLVIMLTHAIIITIIDFIFISITSLSLTLSQCVYVYVSKKKKNNLIDLNVSTTNIAQK
mmetsp:Transcript_31640/g.46503  ORF Transcript_31640/g.46503 Transcript_31640/m.46503 type:complete len:136 (+) Transcript_31640:343-750(+)